VSSLPRIQRFRRSVEKSIAIGTSPCAGLIKISPAPVADPSAVTDDAAVGGNRRDCVQRAKWASCSVCSGAFLGIAATLCDGTGAISTRQSIALGTPAVILIVAGLTAGAVASEVEAACRGFNRGLQVGSTLNWLRSVGSRNRQPM
jgi:hypothetical protein